MVYCGSTGYCMRQPVSLLFPHSRIRKRGGDDKETTSLVVLYITSDTNIQHNQSFFLSVCVLLNATRHVLELSLAVRLRERLTRGLNYANQCYHNVQLLNQSVVADTLG